MFQALDICSGDGWPWQLFDNTANSEMFLRLPLMSATVITNASSYAAVLGAAAMGSKFSPGKPAECVLSDKGLKEALETDGSPPPLEEFQRFPVTFSACGWATDLLNILPGVSSNGWVGWCGAGGSVAFLNPELKASIVWIPDMLDARIAPRGLRLVQAVAADLGKPLTADEPEIVLTAGL